MRLPELKNEGDDSLYYFLKNGVETDHADEKIEMEETWKKHYF